VENTLVGLSSQTYHNCYDKIVRLQILCEMEEIIDFHSERNRMKSEEDMGLLSYRIYDPAGYQDKKR
jgi:hypothetical protein